MATTTEAEDYADVAHPGEREHERAVRYREQALDALDEGEQIGPALVHALLAVEARLEELVVYVAGR